MIQSVKKAMRILEYLAEKDGGNVRLDELSSVLNMPKSTISHLLSTLADGQYVEQTSHTKGYHIGYGVYRLTRFGKYNRKLCDAAHPILCRLNKMTGKSPLVVVLRDDKRINIDYISGDMPISEKGEEIIVENIYNSATGRILLAYLSELELSTIIAKLGPPQSEVWDVEGQGGIRGRLAEIRSRGYEKIICNRSDGKISLGYAVPVFFGGHCVAALGLAFYGEADRKYISLLKKASVALSENLSTEENI